VYVKEHLGHASIVITVDTYGHLLPGANRAAVDRLDDIAPQRSATQTQPETALADAGEQPNCFAMSGEPKFHELEPARRVVWQLEALRGAPRWSEVVTRDPSA